MRSQQLSTRWDEYDRISDFARARLSDRDCTMGGIFVRPNLDKVLVLFQTCPWLSAATKSADVLPKAMAERKNGICEVTTVVLKRGSGWNCLAAAGGFFYVCRMSRAHAATLRHALRKFLPMSPSWTNCLRKRGTGSHLISISTIDTFHFAIVTPTLC